MRIFVPKVSSVFAHKGRNVRFVRGVTTIEEGHPILKGREDQVEPIKIDYPVSEAGKQAPTTPAPAPTPEPAAAQQTSTIDATRGAVKLAAANNVDLAAVTGSGNNGRITADDVRALIGTG